MNLLLVDDQPSIIASLVSCIPWHDLGISSVYTAGSAREAKKLIEEKTVDILISDIEMPGEDGLNLLAWVRDCNMDAECILLTAHADFYYAKRAISLQVSDYIIQPARDEDVVQAVRKAVANRRARSQTEDMIRYQGQDFAVKNMAAQSIFESWPSSQDAAMDPEKLITPLRRLSGFNLSCSAEDECILICGHIRTWHKVPLSPAAVLAKYRRLIDRAVGEPKPTHITWFPDDSLFFTVLFSPLTSKTRAALRQAYEAMDSEIGCALRLFYCGTDMKHIQDSLSSLRSEEEQFGAEHESGAVCFREVEQRIPEWETDPSSLRNIRLLEEIKKYILSNMAEPITRTQIAEALTLSPSYVSHLIKELENVSCKEFITKIKMEHARNLLRGTRCAIGDIAAQCGYDSFAYFSKVYRTYYGITPSQEREKVVKEKSDTLIE